MEDSALPVSETAQGHTISARLERLERRLNYFPAVLPYTVLFGAVQNNGYWSHSLTSPAAVFRVDTYVTAPTLDYDLSTSDAFATIAATTQEVEIEILGFGAFADQTIVTISAAADQHSGFVNLIDTVGEDILGRFVAFRIKVGHTGGTGEAAAIRLIKPLILRIRDA